MTWRQVGRGLLELVWLALVVGALAKLVLFFGWRR